MRARPPSIPFDDIFSGWTAKIKRMRLVDWADTLFPCFRWIRTYRWSEYFKLDLMAGITVGIMLVPQAMSYAKLAGLPPIYGLYSSFVPIFVYAIFGSSRQLAIGHVALVSLLVLFLNHDSCYCESFASLSSMLKNSVLILNHGQGTFGFDS